MAIKKCSIYCFTNLINGKQYIGSTTSDPQHRYNQHIYNATHEENNSKYNYPLYRSIRKRGIDNYKFEVIYQTDCEESEIRKIEHQYIKQYNTLTPNGYNQTDDTTQPMMTPEIAFKVSETKRENAKNVVEIDSNNNILNKWRSIADCAEQTSLDEKKVAAVCRGERKTTANRIFRWIDENNNLIIPEYKRDYYKGEPGSTQIQSSSRKVAKIDLQTNEILAIYDTIALAARENNCDNSGISKVCRGIRTKAGGYGWKYIDNKGAINGK